MIGDGTWRKKRGISKAYFALVKNELLGLVPPPTVETTAPQATPAHDFTEIMTLAAANGVTLEMLNEICVHNGLQNSGELASRPDLHDAVFMAIESPDRLPF